MIDPPRRMILAPDSMFLTSILVDLTNLANAFTRRGLVKQFWNLDGSGSQPSGPAPPDAGTEAIPDPTLQPTTASWQGERWFRCGAFGFGHKRGIGG